MARGKMRAVWAVVLMVVLVAVPAGGVAVGRSGTPPDDAGAAPVPGELPDTPSWTVQGQVDGDVFATALASAGDVNGDGYADVIVGAKGHPGGFSQGKAYVYHGSASGLGLSADWTATGEGDGDLFGGAVSGAGDVNGDGYDDVVVAAMQAASGMGKIYVYAGSPSGLSSTPSWTAEGQDQFGTFGYSVAGAGDVNGDGYHDIVVGAIEAGETGEAYLYLGSATGIGAPDWTASGESSGDLFGTAVAGAGDVNGDGYADVAVGAPAHGANDLGAAYVYHGSAMGLGAVPDWTQLGTVELDGFGRALAGAGDVNGDGYADLVVGSRNGASAEGKADVFPGSASGLEDTALWSTTGAGAGDQFGWAVDGAGDIDGDGYADLLVGAPERGTSQGIIYVFRGSESGLATVWLTFGEVDNDRFGVAVAGAGDVNGDGFADIVAGSEGYLGGARRGKAYGYYGRGDHPSLFDDWNRSGESAGHQYGFSVASAGDVNGDGYADLIVGAPTYGEPHGKAYAYYGSATVLPATPDWTAEGEQAGIFFGVSVASAGDVNGDGYADVAVGAHDYPTGVYQGKVYVYHGGPAGLSASPDWTAEGENNWQWFGSAVASAGDLNGDGYADLIVGAYGHMPGKVYVYFGSATGLSANPDWTAVGESNADHFGISVSGAGDVNGDGYADLVIGANEHPYPPDTPRGKAYVYHGGPAGPGSTPDWTMTGEYDWDEYGEAVSAAGDVNGDGYADVAVAAPYGPNLSWEGKVYVYHGSPAGLSLSADWEKTGDEALERFGSVVATAGDVDGDGFADLLVATEYHPSGTNRGQAYIFRGGATGLAADYEWVATGENDHARFGFSAASAGDVNGDGYPEVIVGAPGYPVESDPGKAFLYYGNYDQGRAVLARQLRGDGSGQLVQPWGLAHEGSRFEVGMWATNPMGRGRVKLETEVCPPGVAFGAGTCRRQVTPTWTDVTTASTGIEFVEMISGLQADTLYRWRARVLYAPYTVTEPGIVPPPNPAHGPWRRFHGQAFEADLRTLKVWEMHLPVVVRE